MRNVTAYFFLLVAVYFLFRLLLIPPVTKPDPNGWAFRYGVSALTCAALAIASAVVGAGERVREGRMNNHSEPTMSAQQESAAAHEALDNYIAAIAIDDPNSKSNLRRNRRLEFENAVNAAVRAIRDAARATEEKSSGQLR